MEGALFCLCQLSNASTDNIIVHHVAEANEVITQAFVSEILTK